MSDPKKFLFSLRPTIQGPTVDSFHQVTENETETKSVIFAMKMRNTANMTQGILMITVEDDVDLDRELLETYIKSLSVDALQKFIQESKVD
jgi:hypothetical protein